MLVVVVYEHVCLVGERGQVTIPKVIRDEENLKGSDKVLVRLEGRKIVIEKLGKIKKDELLKEYYLRYARLNEEIAEEWKYASKEADAVLE